jgi:hypothetical protein
MSLRTTPLRRVATLAAAAAILAACSGGNDAASSTATEPDTIPLSTLPSSTSSSKPEATTTTEAATTTTVAPLVYPLTGLPAPDALAALRPVVVAKIGNYDGHPQSGLNRADIVYEELINDNVSRFAAAYQSQSPTDAVGPIRSGRLQDVNLLGSFNGPILAWSGGNATVTREIDDSDLVNLNQTHCAGACFRVNFDKAPYNLFFNIDQAWVVGSSHTPGSPPQQFQYREQGAPPAGAPSAGVSVVMDSYHADWTWNAATGLYDRSQNGKPDKERNGEQVNTNNVVVLAMQYLPGISGSPDAQSVGSGETWVFTGGNMIHGTWTRNDRKEPFTLTADDGTPILLTPGRTFVELPRAAYGTVAPK